MLKRKVSKGFVSDYVQDARFEKGEFNLIVAGCGTGKTYWVAKNMLKQFDGVKPEEVLFVTSRAMIVDQQAGTGAVKKYDPRNSKIVQYWNRECDDIDIVESHSIHVMTFDKLIHILNFKNSEGYETLGRIKIFVIDECHALFSDGFISGVDMLRVWIKTKIDEGKQWFIGLTATPGIVYASKNWGVGVREVVDNLTIVNYGAKQLICTDFRTLPFLFSSNRLEGKTIVMCATVADCYKLQSQVANAAVLVGRSNRDEYTAEMAEIRAHIINHETLPDYFTFVPRVGDPCNLPKSQTRMKLDVLITTSTMREGINLNANSGVRNVICCYGDELHITQFVGRCRFNIDNLIVTQSFIRSDNIHQDTYIARQRRLFSSYMSNKSNLLWFYSISHLVDHDVFGVKSFTIPDFEMQFIDYINSRWLLPPGATPEMEKEKWIYRDEDKEEIRQKAVKHGICGQEAGRISFLKVIKYMNDKMGYDVQSARGYVDGDRYSYKLVVAFEESEYAAYTVTRKISADVGVPSEEVEEQQHL